MWILFAFASAFFAGITAVLAKCGLEEVNSNVATFLRTGVVLIFAWMIVLLTGVLPQIGDITLKSLLFLVLSGITTGASWLCYFKALQMGDVNKVTPVDKSSTIITMLLAAWLLGESLSWLKVVSMILMGVGTWLMLQRQPGSPDAVKEENARRNGKSSVSGVDRPSTPAIEYSSTEDSNRTEWAQWLSDGMKLLARPGMWLFFAFGSAFFAAITAILGKIGIENVDSNLGTAIRTIVVFLMAWQLVLVTGRQKEIKSIHWKSWCFIVLSGCATGASWLCYYHALQSGPASVIVPIDKLSVLVTILFSRLVFHERLSRMAQAGLGLLVAGTLLLLVS